MIPIEYLQTKSTLWYVTGKLAFNGIKVHIIFEPLPLVDYTGDVFPTFFGTEEGGNANRLQIRGRSKTLPQDGLLEYTTQGGCSVTTRFSANTVYDIWMDKSGMTINNVRTDYPTPCTTVMGCNLPINGSGARAETAKYYFVGFYNEDGSVIEEYQPVLDEDDNVCFYQTKAKQYLYHTGTGNPTGGTPLHIFTATPSLVKFDATGGTLSFTVAAETGWTCTTPTAFTISTTAGTSGDTVVTVTAPNYTGSTRIDEDITLTDDDGYTASVHLRQKPVSTGVQSNIYLGGTNIEVLKLGDKAVESIYLGDVQVYAQGEFQGLKTIPKTVGLNIVYQSKDIKVKSSEPWTLSIDPSATWLSASTVSGDSGVTVVTLTVDTGATGGQSAVTTVISATSANYSAATTVEYAEYSEYYMHKNSGQPLSLLLPISPRQIYDNDNYYIKWVFAVMNQSREYTYQQTEGQWFSYEGDNTFHYFNLGGGASYRPYLESGNSKGRLLPITAVVDNGHFTANWNGIDYDYGNINYNLTNDQQVFLLPTGGASDFFFMYFYNKAGNLIYQFEPYKMMVNNVEVKGIIDKLTGTMYTTQQGSGTYDILDFDQGDWN